jgi:putative flavoprotein involved in K+ transport
VAGLNPMSVARSLALDSRPSAAPPVVVIGAGQSGLAAARELHRLNVPTLVLEAGDKPGGSWPHYYDSLRVFSPPPLARCPA